MAKPTGTRKIRFIDRLIAAVNRKKGTRRHVGANGEPNTDAVISHQDGLDARERAVLEGIGVDFQKRTPRREAKHGSARNRFETTGGRAERAGSTLSGAQTRYDGAKEAVSRSWVGRLVFSGVGLVLAVIIETGFLGAAFSIVFTDGFSGLVRLASLGMAAFVVYFGHLGGKYIAQGRWRPAVTALGVGLVVNAALVPLRVAATEAITQAAVAGGWANAGPAQTGSNLMMWIALAVLPIAFSGGAGMLAYDHHSSDDAATTRGLLHASRVLFAAWITEHGSSRIAHHARRIYERRLVKLRRHTEQYLVWALIARAQADETKSIHREELAIVAGTAAPAVRANLRPLGSESEDLTIWERRAWDLLDQLDRDLATLRGNSRPVDFGDQIRKVA